MSGSHASGGGFGIALLLGCGIFGFYTMSQIVRPGVPQVPSLIWSVAESEVGDPPPRGRTSITVPEVRSDRDTVRNIDPNEKPDFLPDPAMIMPELPDL